MTQASARELAELGYVIFPIEGNGKTPLVRWSTESTRSVLAAESYWAAHPRHNIGISTGASDLLVIDLDSQEAHDFFMRLWARHEHEDPGLVIATRRGWHLYFEQPGVGPRLRNTAGKLGPGIDTRGDGGMVIAPGSVVQGYRYTVVRGTLSAVPRMPVWLHHLLVPKPQTLAESRRRLCQPRLPQAQRALERWCNKIVNAPEGTQNSTINKAAFVLGRDFCPPLDIEEVRHELEMASEQGNHPRRRYEPTIRSGLRGRREPG